MTPETFLAKVAQPNMMEALERSDDMRAIINAILTLDALAGVIFVARQDAGEPVGGNDGAYKAELADVSWSFRVVRDMAYSIKHGRLTDAKIRFVRSTDALQSVPNQLGLMRAGDHIGSEVIVIEFDPGALLPTNAAGGYVRASDAIADSFRMLKRIVEGDLARTDENETAFFMGLQG